MVKTSVAPLLLALSLSACKTDPPACVLFSCSSDADCPTGPCDLNSGLCQDSVCTTGGGTMTAASSSSASNSSGGGTTAGSTNGALTSGGLTIGGVTTGGFPTAGIGTGGSTIGGTTGASCQPNICGPCTLDAGCCMQGTQTITCDPTRLLCAPPNEGVAQCPTGGGSTGGVNGCTPVKFLDGGFCSPGGCFCGADYDCCSGCCDLSAWPGVCRNPVSSGGSAGMTGCAIQLDCFAFGEVCASSGTPCCGSNGSTQGVPKCQSNACCQDSNGQCITDIDCCSGHCDSSTFVCGS